MRRTAVSGLRRPAILRFRRTAAARHLRGVLALPAVLLAGAAALLGGCADDPISRKYPCRFLFYTQWHPTSMIVSALSGYNDFVRISMGLQGGGGAYVVNVANSRGQTESNRLTNELENRFFTSGIYLGAGGSTGALLLGQTNFNGYVAWDALCPNCTASYSSKYLLQWTDNAAQVKCGACSRIYSLETGNILSGAEGQSLLRYIVTYTPGVSVQIGN